MGQPVTDEEKLVRANEIVTKLTNHALWHSHGRFLGPQILKDVLRLEIDAYPEDNEVKSLIRTYNDLLTDHVEQQKVIYYIHEKRKIAEG